MDAQCNIACRAGNLRPGKKEEEEEEEEGEKEG